MHLRNEGGRQLEGCLVEASVPAGSKHFESLSQGGFLRMLIAILINAASGSQKRLMLPRMLCAAGLHVQTLGTMYARCMLEAAQAELRTPSGMSHGAVWFASCRMTVKERPTLLLDLPDPCLSGSAEGAAVLCRRSAHARTSTSCAACSMLRGRTPRCTGQPWWRSAAFLQTSGGSARWTVQCCCICQNIASMYIQSLLQVILRTTAGQFMSESCPLTCSLTGSS